MMSYRLQNKRHATRQPLERVNLSRGMQRPVQGFPGPFRSHSTHDHLCFGHLKLRAIQIYLNLRTIQFEYPSRRVHPSSFFHILRVYQAIEIKS